MPIIINHITIAARDKKASTEWMTMLLRLSAGRVVEPFAFVELDEPTLDASIATMPRFKMQHVALRVIMISEATQLYLIAAVTLGRRPEIVKALNKAPVGRPSPKITQGH
jgi:hypothetical protein